MINTTQNAIVLLKRILSLSDFSPLVLCVDRIAQTAGKLVGEIVMNAKNNSNVKIIYVSFEGTNCPSYADKFIEADSSKLENLTEQIKTHLPSPQEITSIKYLVILDAMNYISAPKISQFVGSIASRHSTLLTIYHEDIPEYVDLNLEHYPSSLDLLNFMSTCIIEVLPNKSAATTNDQLKEELSKMLIPRGLNNDIFQITLTNRRKSGRSLVHSFKIDSKKHLYEVVNLNENTEQAEETPEMLQDLTTFNLSTSAKQKLAKEQVDLPFLEAQSFNTGGAIVYQFEKDDDYDEEDPYEDPF